MDWQTSTTLLRRLRLFPTDEAAWSGFVARYGRLIYRWCRQWGLQSADAEDVTQNVLLELARQMRTFVYDRQGSFRGWLRTVTYRSWSRFLESRKRTGQTGLAVLLGETVGDDLARHLQAESDRELFELASEQVRNRVQPRTWDAFRLLALEGSSGAEAARQLGMNLGAVFVARGKVQRMLRQEIERLELERE